MTSFEHDFTPAYVIRYEYKLIKVGLRLIHKEYTELPENSHHRHGAVVLSAKEQKAVDERSNRRLVSDFRLVNELAPFGFGRELIGNPDKMRQYCLEVKLQHYMAHPGARFAPTIRLAIGEALRAYHQSPPNEQGTYRSR